MGVTLKYAKIVDRDTFLRQGGEVRPGLDSEVRLLGDPEVEPAPAAPFLVLRGWARADGAFTETWRILDPHGRTVHPPVERDVLPADTDISDEVPDQRFEYADEGYQLVIEVDQREIARASFRVRQDAPGGQLGS